MPLFKRRQELAAMAEREAAGESFWTEEFSEPVRTKISLVMLDLRNLNHVWEDDPAAFARRLVSLDEGRYQLAGKNDPGSDFSAYLHSCADDTVPSLLEAFLKSIEPSVQSIRKYLLEELEQAFTERVNRILSEHRISYEFVEGEIVSFKSKELHVSVVVPALRLLSGTSGWEDAEKAYQDALQELSENHPADAITDAGRALQIVLTKLGAEGNALGPLIRSAKSKGILGSHDGTLTEAMEKALHWASANRSERGEAHIAGTNELDDAWMMVHIVGAVVLRLAKSVA